MNAWIVIESADGALSQHEPGCQVMKALMRAGWQIVRIYRAAEPEEVRAA